MSETLENKRDVWSNEFSGESGWMYREEDVCLAVGELRKRLAEHYVFKTDGDVPVLLVMDLIDEVLGFKED
jgi:hypothetical protein